MAICNQDRVDDGYCDKTDIGGFVLSPNVTDESKAMVRTEAIHLNDISPINYPIRRSGYYCVITQGFTVDKYDAVTEFRNAYGELRASEIPKLPFYGVITILYALLAMYWGFLYYQHRSDICKSSESPP